MELVDLHEIDEMDDKRVPVAPLGVEFEDQQLLFRGEVTSLYIGLQVIQPPQTTALAGSPQTYIINKS